MSSLYFHEWLRGKRNLKIRHYYGVYAWPYFSATNLFDIPHIFYLRVGPSAKLGILSSAYAWFIFLSYRVILSLVYKARNFEHVFLVWHKEIFQIIIIIVINFAKNKKEVNVIPDFNFCCKSSLFKIHFPRIFLSSLKISLASSLKCYVIYKSQTSTEDSALVTGGFLREKSHRFGLHFL